MNQSQSLNQSHGQAVICLLLTHSLNYSNSTLKLNIHTFNFFAGLYGRAD